jgi:hypothetical protein
MNTASSKRRKPVRVSVTVSAKAASSLRAFSKRAGVDIGAPLDAFAKVVSIRIKLTPENQILLAEARLRGLDPNWILNEALRRHLPVKLAEMQSGHAGGAR